MNRDLYDVLDQFHQFAKAYIENLDTRSVFPSEKALEGLKKFDIELQNNPINPQLVLKELNEAGSPATVLSTGSRYFGFVIGGSLPAALGANLMAGVWDQNAGLEITSPVSASHLERISRKWLVSCSFAS